MPTDESRFAMARLRAVLPPVVVFALAAGSLGADLAAHTVSVVSVGALVLQAIALVFRTRAPVAVFTLVVLLDAVLLGTSGGELATGALGVMFAAFTLMRSSESRSRFHLAAGGAIVTLVVSAIAMGLAAVYPPIAIIAVAVVRPVLQYGGPAALAEFLLAREKLVTALRDRAELAERERARDVEREIAEVRGAMARELHDIAAHHLSGIIVGAQAASALATTDPERTREMLRTVQQDARTTLADLRRTVGLLRSDSTDDPDSAGRPTPVPALDRVPELVHTAQARGQDVELAVEGPRDALGPLAETAGYRMVQESLANAARHAPGAPSRVHVEYLSDVVRVTVTTDPVSDEPAPGDPPSGAGYGISGMQERADLVHARLTTGHQPDGSWRNVLEIPRDTRRSTP